MADDPIINSLYQLRGFGWWLFVWMARIVDCLLAIVFFLIYPVLQGYALFKLRQRLRLFAWAILILVVSFSLWMFGSIFAAENQYAVANGIAQLLAIFTAWMVAA